MKQLETYTYTIPAGGSIQIPAPNDNFYVNASTGPLSVRGDTFGRLRGLVAGQGLKGVPFNRLELIDESGAPNTVTILLTPAEFVNQVFSGSVSIIGGVLTDAQLRASRVPVRAELPYSISTTVSMVSGAATLLTPAQNTNGFVIANLEAAGTATAGVGNGTFLAKTSAPTTLTDGDLLGLAGLYQAGATNTIIGKVQNVVVPAGKGIYWYGVAGATYGANSIASLIGQQL